MVDIITRQRRYNALRFAGFLPFEARAYSSIPLDAPWIREMIRERRTAYVKAKRLEMSLTAWREVIRELYKDKGLTKLDKLFRVRLDPWKNLRRWKDMTEDKYPEYESPSISKSKKKKRNDFPSKYAKGLENYEKGRGR